MMEHRFPLDRELLESIFRENGYHPNTAAIRETAMVIREIEERTGCPFFHMEFGVPGLEPNPIGPQAEKEALDKAHVASTYPILTGLPFLKEEGARFFDRFLNLSIPPKMILPTVGAMQGGFLAQAFAGRRFRERDRILFVDPCFSVHRAQTKFLGLREESVDLIDRETWLDRVEDLCKSGTIGGVLYSTPNNPTWVILTESELQRLGKICEKYDVVAIEDLAYFGMDFRVDYSKPGEPPYPPTVARYTKNYILLFSSSKVFSYAGQRVGLVAFSPQLASCEFENLAHYFGHTLAYNAFFLTGAYCTTSGVSHSSQYGLAALLREANDGRYRFLQDVSVYAERAKKMKEIFLSNGFYLVYDRDLDQPLSDGFFFTLGFPGLSGDKLVRSLISFGISSTTLTLAGSTRKDAIRACSSAIEMKDMDELNKRVSLFAASMKESILP